MEFEEAQEMVAWLEAHFPTKKPKVAYLYSTGRYGVALDWSIGPLVLVDLYGVRVFKLAHRSGSLQFATDSHTDKR